MSSAVIGTSMEKLDEVETTTKHQTPESFSSMDSPIQPSNLLSNFDSQIVNYTKLRNRNRLIAQKYSRG